MIKLVVLGSGAAMPTKETIPSCFAVKYGDVFLFDAAEGVQRQLMLYGVSYAKIKAIFLTHLHADHFLGLLGLIQTMNLSGREDALKIYGPAGTTSFLTDLFSFKGLKPKFPLVIKDARKGVVLRDKLYTVRAFETDHSCESLGYSFAENSYLRFHEETARAAGVHGHLFTELMEKKKLEINKKIVHLKDVTYKQDGKKIIFSGDTVPCSALARAAKNADLLIHDSCFAKAQESLALEKKHSTAEQAAKIAKKAGVKQLMLTHISNRYNDRGVLLKEAQAVFPNTVIASEGMELMV